MAFADISTADLPAGPSSGSSGSDSSETTQQFVVSPELQQYAQVDDVEMTVDIDHVTGSACGFPNPARRPDR